MMPTFEERRPATGLAAAAARTSRRWFIGAAGAAALLATTPLEAATPVGRLSLRNLHTDERLDVEFRRGRDYDRRALAALDHLLRDWRQNEMRPIDPRLFDMMVQIAARVGQPPNFGIISGYRSPRTNEMLRRNGRGAAKRSLHMIGRAIDLKLAGTRLSTLRRAAMELGAGGVGYYPASGFVHIDTGDVRSWAG
jgi:uncharacterized protein YcbK (DUF882 family)